MTEFKYVVTTKSRHGKVVRYYRPPGGKKIRLHHEPGTAEYRQEYLNAKLKDAESVPVITPVATGVGRAIPQSLRWLVVRHKDSAYFKSLDKLTRRYKASALERICESIHPETGKPRGDLPYKSLKRANVIAIRDHLAQFGPAAADNAITHLRVLFNWAIDNGLATETPVVRIPRLWEDGDGFHTWTQEEMRAFEMRHPVGTKARLAYAIMLYQGVRPSDCIRLGPQHARSGFFEFAEYKGGHSTALSEYRPEPKRRVMQIDPDLQRIIDKTPREKPKKGTHQLFYILSKRGTPFNDHSFHDWFKRRTAEAGISHCSAHGIRKGGATAIAEAGGDPHALMGLYGWKRLEQAERYTRKANRLKLATRAQSLLPRLKGRKG